MRAAYKPVFVLSIPTQLAPGRRSQRKPRLTERLLESAAEPMKPKSRQAAAANAKREDIQRPYKGARQIWVHSGHGIPLEKPDAVISAIREALAESAVAPGE